MHRTSVSNQAPVRDAHPEILGAWAAVATIVLSVTRTDPDLWGHLRFGLDILDSWSLPSVDPYSFTQDRPWVNHEWLSEVAMAVAYRLAGPAGLVVLKVAVVAAALAVLARAMRDVSAVVTAIVLSMALAGVLPLAFTVRPQLWSLLGLCVVSRLLNAPRYRLAHCLAFTAIFAAWANLHGGWIVGMAEMSVYMLSRTVRDHRLARTSLVSLSCALAGTLLTPYGWRHWAFLLETVRLHRGDILEWQPLIRSPGYLWLPVVVVLGTAGLVALRRRGRPALEVWMALLVLVAGAISVTRVSPLIAPAALILLAPSIRAIYGSLARLQVSKTPHARMLLVPAAVLWVVAFGTVRHALACIPLGGWSPDVTTAAALAGRTGRLWTSFEWGEYAIWHFGPDLRVSVDGRRETIYSDTVLHWNRDFERGGDAGRAAFERLAPHYVWLPFDASIASWLADHGYVVDVQTARALVARRADLPPLRPTQEPASACFP